MINGEIKAGDVLYDVARCKMGNTTMTRLAWWPVRVYAVDGNRAWTSWNGNLVRLMPMSQLRKYRRSIPKSLVSENGSAKPCGSVFDVPDGWEPPTS